MCELVLKNGTIVDVKNRKLIRGDLAVSDGKIIGIGTFSGKQEVDCQGKYLCPGFIDAHVHIESSMAAPLEFAKAVMPHGTTTVIADPHELVNVKGNEAMKYILDATEDIPLSVYVMMPSSIPATPFETNGADFTAKDMEQWKDHKRVLGLGEVMCYPAVLSGDPEILEKLRLCRGMIIDGHAPGLTGEDLKAYVEAGVMTEHECTSYEEAREKCHAGMKILVREGSAARNVENIIPGLLKEPQDMKHYMFCTDDKHLDTIENEGHISYNVRRSIQLGMDPLDAVAMATEHAASAYGLNQIGTLETGKDADIVVLGSLEEVSVEQVYRKGRLVNDAMFDRQAAPIAESMLHTVVLSGVSKDKIQVPARGKVPVIGMVSGQIVTKFLREEVPSCEGWFVPNREYSKLCVFERHRGTGNAKAAPLKGYGITGGAIATSVAHDSHNIIAAGDNDDDILTAVQMMEKMQGGYVLVSGGEVKGTLPLPVAGLLSLGSSQEIQENIDDMLKKAWDMGISREIDPFITLSFMALPVIPELRLTDLGLVDVTHFKQIET
ncbi:MAG TPA: adenine deaminase [Candidatus Anaerostipes avicola]|uniref:adenine deaminase n=1 Tax=Anaerostipes butyraticus TaxID=645466 RepID=UPI001F849522|nr:adenine deaminase [Anaerostipes butyraticus]HJC82476.1 adenine deaminase [Candidatus Anaerostipes avicola]